MTNQIEIDAYGNMMKVLAACCLSWVGKGELWSMDQITGLQTGV